MAKSLKGVWLFILCLALTSCSQFNQTKTLPQAKDGFLDLQKWDFEQSGNIPLNGEWAFYWQELLSPSDINSETNFLFVTTPNDWTSYEINGQALPSEGFATYRLVVQLAPQTYGLFIDGEGTAYSLWVDGKLIAKNGQVATNKEDMIPQRKPDVVFFDATEGGTEFVIQISNWHHRKAGFRSELLLGLPTQIHEYRRNQWSRDSFVMGIYLVMGLYHIFLFISRPTNKSPLYFAIWSFLNLLRAGLLNQKIFTYIFPSMSWTVAIQIEYLTFFFSTSTYAVFIQSLYPKDVPQWVIRILFGFSFMFSAFMLFAGTLVASKTISLYQGIILVEMIYFIYFLIKIIQNKRDGALYITVGSIIAFLGVIGEILYLQNISPIYISSVYTFLAFIVIQATLLASRFSNSFQRVEALSSELEEANASLSESEFKYRTIFEDTKDMIFIADLEEHILDVNPAGIELLGYDWMELIGMKISHLLMRPEEREQVADMLRGNMILRDHELELRKKNGEPIKGLVTLSLRKDNNGEVTGIHGHVHDLTILIQAEQQKIRAATFERLSLTDPLTHAYNRRFFDEVVIKELERAKRSKSKLAIILLDIDHFKKINDTFGHSIGDQVLIRIVEICQDNLRNMDIFARYGGEEFAIIMPDTNHSSARKSMERLRTIMQKTSVATHENNDIYVTVSIGLTIYDGSTETGMDIKALIKQADQALYASKEQGRNQVTDWMEI